MEDYAGRTVSKSFVNAKSGRSRAFRGTVVYLGKQEEPYAFEVRYTDGDKETMDLAELQRHLVPVKAGKAAAGAKRSGTAMAPRTTKAPRGAGVRTRSAATEAAAAGPAAADSPPFKAIYVSTQQHAELWKPYNKQYKEMEEELKERKQPQKYTTGALMRRHEPASSFRVRHAADSPTGWSIELLSACGRRSLGRCSTSPSAGDAEGHLLDRYGRYDEVAAFMRKHAAGGFKVTFEESVGCEFGLVSNGSITFTALLGGEGLVVADTANTIFDE